MENKREEYGQYHLRVIVRASSWDTSCFRSVVHWSFCVRKLHAGTRKIEGGEGLIFNLTAVCFPSDDVRRTRRCQMKKILELLHTSFSAITDLMAHLQRSFFLFAWWDRKTGFTSDFYISLLVKGHWTVLRSYQGSKLN